MAVEDVTLGEIQAASFLEIDPLLPKEKRDGEADRQIVECLSSPIFVNRVIKYSYDFRSWDIRLIYNPQHLVFSFAKGAGQFGGDYALITRDVLPKELSEHLQALIKQELGDARGYISFASTTCLRGESYADFDWYSTLTEGVPVQQVQLCPMYRERVFSEEGDQKFLECFNSPKFVNKVIDYEYGVGRYQIRVIYNPENLPLSGKGFEEIENRSFIVTSNRVLPSSLENHLKELASNGGGLFDISSCREYSFDAYASLQPDLAWHTSDQKALDFFASEKFVNTAFPYTFAGKTYSLRIIHNPERKPLWREGFSEVVYWPLVITSKEVLPYKLEHHLKKLASMNGKEVVLEVSSQRNFSFESYAQIEAVSINKDGELNDAFDAQIKEAFSSADIVNKVFYYQINGKDYKVRIIHNPGKIGLVAAKALRNNDIISLNFSSEYGILVDNPAPSEFIDHLTTLIPPPPQLSWWEWLWSEGNNSKASNGAPVRYTDAAGDRWEMNITDFEFFDVLGLVK